MSAATARGGGIIQRHVLAATGPGSSASRADGGESRGAGESEDALGYTNIEVLWPRPVKWARRMPES